MSLNIGNSDSFANNIILVVVPIHLINVRHITHGFRQKSARIHDNERRRIESWNILHDGETMTADELTDEIVNRYEVNIEVQ